jgi:iron(III) transport system substrate-binding protein
MKIKIYFFAFVLTVAAVQSVFAAPATKKPTTAAELALYKGTDRQQILEEGAKKEGKLVLYTTGILNQTVTPKVNAFQKKYPYIKVEIWRAETVNLVSKFLQEYGAGRYAVDVIEVTQPGEIVLEEKKVLQPFTSPNLASIDNEAIKKGPGGEVLAAGHYESGRVLGYNTKLVKKDQLPKTNKDLADPKWKGKVAIAGSSSGVNWMGTILNFEGEELVQKIARQNFDLHEVSARAILDMIINGEYVFSPTCTDSHVIESKKKGAPVDWIPLEPVQVNSGQIMMPKYPQNPHAVMLFIDFDLSKEVGILYRDTGYDSPRKDIPDQKTYKKYYGPESTEQFAKWLELFNKYFIKK